MYRNYSQSLKSIAPHNLLALYRGEQEKILNVNLTFNDEIVSEYLAAQVIKTSVRSLREFYQTLLTDAFQRLMKTSLITEVRGIKKLEADQASIQTFAANLKELLLAAPAGMKPTCGIDPGFRTGCKVAILDHTGKFLEYQAIFPHTGQPEKAAKTLRDLLKNIKLN